MASQPKRKSPENPSSGAGPDNAAAGDPQRPVSAGVGKSDKVSDQTANPSTDAAGAAELQTMLADAFDERLRIAPLIEEDDVEEEAETFAEPTEPDAAATQRQAAKGGAAK